MQNLSDAPRVKIIYNRFFGIGEEEMIEHGAEVEPLTAVAQEDYSVHLARLDIR